MATDKHLEYIPKQESNLEKQQNKKYFEKNILLILSTPSLEVGR